MGDKFKAFEELCADAKDGKLDEVWIASPWVLGDTYDEVMMNLGRLADAKLALRIMEPNAEEAAKR